MNILNDWPAYLPGLLAGLGISVQVALLSLLVGLPGGLLLAIGASSKKKLVRVLIIGIVEVGRGTPALVVLQIFYFGLPASGLTLSSMWASVVALAATTAAYTSEILRGGLQAVPQGEVEAAGALGMSRRDTLRFIVIPQGFRVAIPSLIGFAILIFQATSLAYTVALPELLSQAYSIGSTTFNYLSVLVLAGLMYAAITIPASWLTSRAEKRLARHL
ncbi:polar amino acid transport system permease protein [Arthrobacter pascens]|uniref:amino acid ABC transporter permease n=1 Tax=Arthrobacter pascens TaxID=1677 RepID=UPI002855844C|nr:amino acid ABC transporter permease [Arthrobacter pascens]MDR6558788.1 polar amino acid transport system permease protein [Arthrobacter pascens]